MPDNITADNSLDFLLRVEASRYVWRQGEHKNCGAALQALQAIDGGAAEQSVHIPASYQMR